MNIGAKLKREREAQGLTLEQVSEATGIAVANLSRFESDRNDSRFSTIQRVAEALGVELSLVEADAEPPNLLEMAQRAKRARDVIMKAGLGESDPVARLERRAAAGQDVSVEREALEQRMA